MTVIEAASGLKNLRFDTELVTDNGREMQSMLDRNGRILGWFSWERERPATAMMHRLLPFAALIALGLLGFAALTMWQLSRLGGKLAMSERQVQKLECEDALTGLPNHNYFFELFDEALAARKATRRLRSWRSISMASTTSTTCSVMPAATRC